MSISIEHLAELLSGIARSQQAIVDAIERENGGWRNRQPPFREINSAQLNLFFLYAPIAGASGFTSGPK